MRDEDATDTAWLLTISQERLQSSTKTRQKIQKQSWVKTFFKQRIQSLDTYIVLDDFPDQDILDVCRRYYSMIEQLVLECQKQFAT